MSALICAALATAGCGLGPGADVGDVELTVTREYGAVPVLDTSVTAKESDTVMRVLEGEADVETRYGGGFVHRSTASPRVNAAAIPTTGSSTSTGSNRRSGRPITTSRAASASGGTTTTGPRRTTSRRLSAPGPPRSETGSAASATRWRWSAWNNRAVPLSGITGQRNHEPVRRPARRSSAKASKVASGTPDDAIRFWSDPGRGCGRTPPPA